MSVKALLNSRYKRALIGVQSGLAVYSFKKLIDIQAEVTDCDWDAAHDFIEYHIVAEARALSVIVRDDLDDSTADTLDQSED